MVTRPFLGSALNWSLFFMFIFWVELFSPFFFIFCDEGPHLHPLFYTGFFLISISVFMTSLGCCLNLPWHCFCLCSPLLPLWKCLIRVLLLPEIFTWEVETSHFSSSFPFLPSFSPPLVVFGQPSRSFQSWLLSIVPFSFGHLLGGYFMCKKA